MKTIYLTYDGILDPLGQSQILPYLRHTRSYVSLLHILSFEKYKKTDEMYLKQANELKDRSHTFVRKFRRCDDGYRHRLFCKSNGKTI